jgi:hypothetical protein
VADNHQHNRDKARQTEEMNAKFIQEMQVQRDELVKQHAIILGREQRETISRATLSRWDLFDRAMNTYLRLKGVKNNEHRICWYWLGLHTDLHEQAEAFDPDLITPPFVIFNTWRERLKQVFATPADTAMARLHFNQIKQAIKEPIQEYHSRLMTQWNGSTTAWSRRNSAAKCSGHSQSLLRIA